MAGKTARNERLKLRATAFNTAGLGIFAIGVLQPVYAGRFSTSIDVKVALSGLIAYVLHEIAGLWLRRLED